MQCHVEPYKGDDAYVYFVNCDVDGGIAYPMIERLARQGLRIWYDTFNDDINGWVTQVHQKLQNCTAVIILLSKHAVASHLCRERLTEVIELKKPFIVVHHGQSVISPAMRIQVERGTCLESDLIPSEGVVTSILQNTLLQQCRGLTDARIAVQSYQPDDGGENESNKPGYVSIEPSEETIREMKKRSKATSITPVEKQTIPVSNGHQVTHGQTGEVKTITVAPAPVESASIAQPSIASVEYERNNLAQNMPIPTQQILAMQAQPDQDAEFNAAVPKRQDSSGVEIYNQPFEGDGEETIRNSPTVRQSDNEYGESTVVMAPHPRANIAIISMKTGEMQFSGWRDEVLVGRKGKYQNGMTDISIRDDCKLFSRTHFRVVSVEGTHSIVCAHPNGITVNGQDLGKDENIQVDEYVEIVAPNRSVLAYYGPSAGEPATLMVSFGMVSEKVRDATTVACLTSVETGETKYFVDESFELGKSYPWKTGAVALGTISRQHATIHYENGQYILEDHSTNGTELNGELLKRGDRHSLKTGDTIVIRGNTDMNIRTAHFVFRYVTIERTTAL